MTDPDEPEAVPRTRLFQFPGGVLELQSSSQDSADDYGGFYLQLHDSTAIDGHDDQRAVMRYTPTALGYLRTDVSGVSQQWDESEIRRLAARYGYDLAEIVVYDPASGRPPFARLKAQATRLDAEAVFVPSLEHFEEGEAPGSLVQRLDVVTVHPESTYSRRVLPPLSDRTPELRTDRAVTP
ncbi:hypothetical protein [Nocardia concava]|uniref:hypothetical protein n=1 Tax=Nocardia concava TaxID=257281 RepID=UPI0002D58AFA|nr:hypothetical protein [Nocardia concava]